MARVYFNQVWFDSIRSESWNEADYEQVVMANAESLFPHWLAVPFKTNVTGEDGSVRQPDFALVDRLYRRWCVVEAELAHHSLVRHVLPQVEAFRTATYGHQHAAYLHTKNPGLDLSSLKAMMQGVPPEVVVIVDRPDTGWKKSLRALDVSLSIIEPFRGPGDQLLLRVNGEMPDLPGNILTRISRSAHMRRLWKVHSPATLPPPNDEGILEIALDQSPSLWRRVPIGDGVMLSTETGGDILEGWKAVDLIQQDDGSLMLQRVVPERRKR